MNSRIVAILTFAVFVNKMLNYITEASVNMYINIGCQYCHAERGIIYLSLSPGIIASVFLLPRYLQSHVKISPTLQICRCALNMIGLLYEPLAA